MWKKGESGNANGRQRGLISVVIDQLKAEGYERVTPNHIREAFELLMSLDEERLKEIINNKHAPMVLRVVGKRILSGDGHDMLEKMLDRVHGKSKQSIDHSTLGHEIGNINLSTLTNEQIFGIINGGIDKENKG